MSEKGKLKPRGIKLGKSGLDVTDFPNFHISVPKEKKTRKIAVVRKQKGNNKEQIGRAHV